MHRVLPLLQGNASFASAVAGECIGCFRCRSFDHSDPGCDDPFQPGLAHYEENCKQGMKARVGDFPTNYCVKMAGVNRKSLILQRSAFSSLLVFFIQNQEIWLFVSLS